jgi:hypothetical protein
MQQYEKVKQTQEELTKLQEQEDENKELQYAIKEWRYNRENKDPDVDLGDGKLLVTLWKALPEDYEK